MAVLGGILLIVLANVFIWIALMPRFRNIGKKVSERIKNTFGD